MNFEDVVFIIQLILFISIFLTMLYNIMTWGEIIDLKKSFLLFILAVISWGFGFVISIYGFSYRLYLLLFQLENILLYLVVLFFFVIIIINLSKRFIGKGQAYDGNNKAQI